MRTVGTFFRHAPIRELCVVCRDTAVRGCTTCSAPLCSAHEHACVVYSCGRCGRTIAADRGCDDCRDKGEMRRARIGVAVVAFSPMATMGYLAWLYFLSGISAIFLTWVVLSPLFCVLMVGQGRRMAALTSDDKPVSLGGNRAAMLLLPGVSSVHETE